MMIRSNADGTIMNQSADAREIDSSLGESWDEASESGREESAENSEHSVNHSGGRVSGSNKPRRASARSRRRAYSSNHKQRSPISVPARNSTPNRASARSTASNVSICARAPPVSPEDLSSFDENDSQPQGAALAALLSLTRDNSPHAETLTEWQCRQALSEYVRLDCCYGKQPIKQMRIQSICTVSATHYSLQSFIEKRSTTPKVVPYIQGVTGALDGPENGPQPHMWEVVCPPKKLFTKDFLTMEVPHTAVLSTCNSCKGRGNHRCRLCFGQGHVACGPCGRHGSIPIYKTSSSDSETTDSSWNEECHACHGTGNRHCVRCHGHGTVVCKTCNGHKRVKTYLQLEVSFSVRTNNFSIGESELPSSLVNNVEGCVVFQHQAKTVTPLRDCPLSVIAEKSRQFTRLHAAGGEANERRLMQRHVLRLVPVTEVRYRWRTHHSRFWVYGKERRVHAPDYPARNCWGLCVLF